MYKTDKQWTLDNYTAVRTLNNKCLNPRTRRRVARIQTEEEAEKNTKQHRCNRIFNRHRT